MIHGDCLRCGQVTILFAVRFRDVEIPICATCLQALRNARLGRDEVLALDEFDRKVGA